MEIDEKVEICKLAALAIMVDVQLTDTEIEFLDKLMDKYELTEEQRSEVRRRNFDDDPVEIARAITSSKGRAVLAEELTAAATADGKVEARENNLLKRVFETLGLSENDLLDRVQAITSETSD